jgi:iron complex outermembrane receptor protein
LSGTTTATALNPYNVTATNTGVLDAMNNYEIYAKSTQYLSSIRAVADGTIYAGAGGKIKLAIGVEAQAESSDTIATTGRIGTSDGLDHAGAERSNRSAFAELNIPLVGSDNHVTGVDALTLSLSERIDHYSDFGETSNPRIGVTYKPIESLKIRANYGTSFNAPSLDDTIAGGIGTRAQLIGVSPWLKPGDNPSNFNRPTVLLAGGSLGIKPQKGTTHSYGIDFSPKEAKGLRLSVTYWQIKFTDNITVVPFFNPILFQDASLSKFYVINPTQAEMTARVGSLPLDGFSSIADLYNTGRAPYLLTAAQRINFGQMELSGLDFEASYKMKTSFGSLNAFAGGTKQLKRNQQLSPVLPVVDLLPTDISKLAYSAGVGAEAGQLTAQATMYYGAGYTATGIPGQTQVGSFSPVNLYFSYELKGRGLLANTRVSLNIDNVFDKAPPFANNSSGFTNGGTLGRVFQLGIEKRF